MKTINIKKILIGCLATIPLWTSACSGQIKHTNMATIQNDTTHTVWATYNFEGESANWSELHVNYEFIQSLPAPAKNIIARYSAFLPPYLDEAIELNFAQALGGFTSLEEARQTLLKDWEIKNISVEGRIYIYDLKLTTTKQTLSFEYLVDYNKKIIDKFKIDENGKINAQ